MRAFPQVFIHLSHGPFAGCMCVGTYCSCLYCSFLRGLLHSAVGEKGGVTFPVVCVRAMGK